MEENKTISKLYDNYIETDLKTSKKYIEISKQFVDKIEKFSKKLKKKDKKELDKIINLVFDMNIESERQTYIYAYSLGVKLTTEALYQIREK